MKNTNDFSKCKVGQKLWSIQLGECEVIGFDNCLIDCRNKNNNENQYYFNGNNYFDDLIQSLFFDKPEIIAPEKSKEKIPFDLEKALSGEYDLVTREGVLIDEWKWFEKFNQNLECLFIVIKDHPIKSYFKNGKYLNHREHEFDLFLIEK